MRCVVIFILFLHIQEFFSALPGRSTSEECLEEPWECEEDEIIHLETDTCRCGQRTRLASRIVGGIFTAPYEFPWLTYLLKHKNGRASICASSIINSRMLLTAGHCVTYVHAYRPAIIRKRIPLRNLQVFAHVYNRQEVKTVGSHIELEIQYVIVHPKYLRQDDVEDKDQFANYDIALIVLKDDIDITNPDLNPVCLPEETDIIKLFQGRQAILAGWGIYDRDIRVPANFTKKLDVPIHSSQNCLRNYVNRTYRMDLFICADDSDETGAAQGDSGGPLMLQTSTNEFLQIGVVSHGTLLNKFPHFNTITLYSRVTAFIQWIKYHSWGHEAIWCRRTTDPM